MNESDQNTSSAGRQAITADGIVLGPVEADTESHLRIRLIEGDAPGGQIWVPRAWVGGVEGGAVRINRVRADLHEAVLAMPPGQQREFDTLGITVNIGRRRGVSGR